MKLFDTRKKRIIFISSVAAAVAVIVALVVTLILVLPGPIVWQDKLAPEEVEQLDVTSPAIVIPEKPAVAPTVDKTKPTEFGTATASDACYTVMAGTDGPGTFTVSYDSDDALPAYAYVYVPVTNYDGNNYLKIKADCTSVERIAVLAVYYEQYEQSRPAVTVYVNSVMDGENTIVCDLGKGVVLDSVYSMAVGERLTQKSICGFMLMIDSNPKQIIDEYSGTFTVTEISVVDENDPDLNKLYAAPYISAWKESVGFDACQTTTSRIEGADGLNVEATYSVSSSSYPRLEATIANYKPEYTTLKMDIKGTNVKTLSIAIKYNLRSSPDNMDYSYLFYNITVENDWETKEYDFAYVEELVDPKTSLTVPGSYVKNLNPTAIYFFADSGQTNSGTLSVRNVKFEKPESGGAPRVSSTWTLGASGIAKSNVAEGGNGTIVYDKRQGWFPVTINVGSYDPEYSVLTVRVKFYNEYSNLGIALGYGSNNTVVMQNAGMTPPSGLGIILDHISQEAGEDEDGAYIFHTFVIDFTNAKTTAASTDKLAEQPITKIMLYIDAVIKIGDRYENVDAGTALPSARRMQFVGIEFKKPQTEEE